MSEATLSLIVAVAKNGVIGNDNKLLWRLKSDLRRFRALTMGKPIIMGRKTFQSIGCALPGRHSIVVTHDKGFAFEGLSVAHTIKDALALGQSFAIKMNTKEIMIIGGEQIYNQTLPLCQKLYITEVALEPAGDARFLPIDKTVFMEINREHHNADKDNEASFSFVDYIREN